MFDIVIPWTNMSESSYFDVYSREYLSNLEKIHNPYAHVASKRPPYSELVFTLRSLQDAGFMERVGRVYIL
jgi:hypothetical protein